MVRPWKEVACMRNGHVAAACTGTGPMGAVSQSTQVSSSLTLSLCNRFTVWGALAKNHKGLPCQRQKHNQINNVAEVSTSPYQANILPSPCLRVRLPTWLFGRAVCSHFKNKDACQALLTSHSRSVTKCYVQLQLLTELEHKRCEF